MRVISGTGTALLLRQRHHPGHRIKQGQAARQVFGAAIEQAQRRREAQLCAGTIARPKYFTGIDAVIRGPGFQHFCDCAHVFQGCRERKFRRKAILGNNDENTEFGRHFSAEQRTIFNPTHAPSAAVHIQHRRAFSDGVLRAIKTNAQLSGIRRETLFTHFNTFRNGIINRRHGANPP